MRLIAGLGNPGARYKNTRHNVGFEVLDELAQRLGVNFGRTKFDGDIAELSHAAKKVLLLKPLTYMNLSGESLAKAARNRIDDPSQILVAYDDVDLPVGTIRLRKSGSPGTHNGMRSVVERLGTREIPRIRIGVGNTPPGVSLTDYVLSRFRPEERADLDDAVSRAADAAILAIESGMDAAMNQYN